jgi:hypothetical protein
VTSFNLFASQLFLCALAVYDQDVNCDGKDPTERLLMPYLYAETRDKTSFNLTDFLCWYLFGFYVGVC